MSTFFNIFFADLRKMIEQTRPFLTSMGKAKAAKLVRKLVDIFLNMESAGGSVERKEFQQIKVWSGVDILRLDFFVDFCVEFWKTLQYTVPLPFSNFCCRCNIAKQIIFRNLCQTRDFEPRRGCKQLHFVCFYSTTTTEYSQFTQHMTLSPPAKKIGFLHNFWKLFFFQVQLCKECIEWAREQNRVFLRQTLQSRMVRLYNDIEQYQDALGLGGFDKNIVRFSFAGRDHPPCNLPPKLPKPRCSIFSGSTADAYLRHPISI